MRTKQVIPLRETAARVTSGSGPNFPGHSVPSGYTRYAPRDPRADSADGAEFEPSDGDAVKLHHQLAGVR